MPHVVIIGNAGAARECYWILQDLLNSAPALRRYYRFRGFLDWKGHKGDLKELASLHLGSADDYVIDADDLFVIGVGHPHLRKAIFEAFKARGAQFMNLVHPWTDICQSAVLGEGNVFQRGCTVYCNARIGNGNYINGAANLSHDAEIGDFNFLAPYSLVLGGAKLGSCNHLGPHAVLLEHARAGDNNVLAAASCLYKGCGNNALLSGNPALKVGSAADVNALAVDADASEKS